MKQCPICKSIFSNDDDFCPNDGAVLIHVTSTPPSSGGQISGNMPTQILTPPQTHQTAHSNERPVFIYLLLGALGAVAIGAVLFAIWSSGGSKEKFTNAGKVPEEQKSNVTTANVNAAQQPQTAANTAANAASVPMLSPNGRWSGDWSSPSGAYLTLAVDLTDDGTGKITGKIYWTLRRTTRPEKMSMIGMSAVEYVSGRFDQTTRTLTMNGYRKDDPNGVLVMLDSYRLNLSADNGHLNGSARNGGKWNASMRLSR